MEGSKVLRGVRSRVAGLGASVALAGILAAGPGVAAPILLYEQNFNAAGQAAGESAGPSGRGGAAAPDGWAVWVDGREVSGKLLVAGATGGGGGAAAGYYASGDGRDYGLGIYAANPRGKTDYLTFTYTAAQRLIRVSGSFELEAPWTRFDQGRDIRASFSGGLSYSLNGGAWTTALAGAELTLSNVGVTPGFEQTWLTDAQMDALGLSRRQGMVFRLPDLRAGDTLSLRWAALSRASPGGANRNMLLGVDNFRLTGVAAEPLPSTWLLLGTGCLGLACLRRWRARKS